MRFSAQNNRIIVWGLWIHNDYFVVEKPVFIVAINDCLWTNIISIGFDEALDILSKDQPLSEESISG